MSTWDSRWIRTMSRRGRLACWLLHRGHHMTGSDSYEGATYYVRWCSKCGLTVPTVVRYASVQQGGTDV